MIGRRSKKGSSTLEQTRRARRARVVRSNVGSNTIKPLRQPNKSTGKTPIFSRIVVIILITLAIFWSGYTGSVRVQSQDEQQLQSSIQETANNYFSGVHSWWWFVSVDNAVSEMKKSNPYILDAHVNRSIFTRDIIVSVKQRTAALRLIANKQQYLAAGDGVILDSSESSHSQKLPMVYDESSGAREVREGKPYLPAQTVMTISELNTQLTQGGFKVKDFSLTDNTREIRAHLRDAKYYIKFASNIKASHQLKDLNLVKAKLSSAKEYVDVRFDGRVYIR